MVLKKCQAIASLLHYCSKYLYLGHFQSKIHPHANQECSTLKSPGQGPLIPNGCMACNSRDFSPSVKTEYLDCTSKFLCRHSKYQSYPYLTVSQCLPDHTLQIRNQIWNCLLLLFVQSWSRIDYGVNTLHPECWSASLNDQLTLVAECSSRRSSLPEPG